MPVKSSPDADADAMRNEYVKGVTIDDIAEKYGHTPHEVAAIVVREVEDEPVLTQADIDNNPPTSTKKGK